MSAGRALRLRQLTLVVGLGFVAWLVYRTLGQGTIDTRRVDWPAVALSVALGAAGTLGAALLLVSRFRRHGSPVATRVLLRAYFLSQVAKYVPGKVAALWVQISLLGHKGAPHATMMSNVELSVLSMIVNVATGVALLLAVDAPATAALILAAGFALCLLIASARWTATLGARVVAAFGLHVPPTNFATDAVRPALVYLAVNTLVLVPGLVLFLSAALDAGLAESMRLAGAFLLAWVVSIAAFVFPAGLGVREAVFIGVGHGLGVRELALLGTAAVLVRLYQVTLDVVGVGTFLAWDRLRPSA